MEYPHKPVLVHEVVRHLVSVHSGIYVDGTVGTAGHSLAIVKSLSGNGRLICLDRDPEAVNLSRRRLAFMDDRVCVMKKNYADLGDVLKRLGVNCVHGVLLDLGMSSLQLEKSGRGFSFLRDEPLDMRMDPDEDLTAYYLVNNLPARQLEGILREYGEETRAGLITKAIVRARRKTPIAKSSQLADLISSAFFPFHQPQRKHPATRTFQALRIAVNRELENLKMFLDRIPPLLMKGGRLVVLSYHSLEDRLVKQAMSNWENRCTCPPDFPHCVCGKEPTFRRLFKKALKPGREEIQKNPRARSVRLRAAERV